MHYVPHNSLINNIKIIFLVHQYLLQESSLKSPLNTMGSIKIQQNWQRPRVAATSKEQNTCDGIPHMIDMPELNIPPSREPICNECSCEQQLIETIHPSSGKRERSSLSQILFQISFYVIDLVNFNPYQLHCYGNHTLKGYIPILPATHTTFSCHKILIPQNCYKMVNQLGCIIFKSTAIIA